MTLFGHKTASSALSRSHRPEPLRESVVFLPGRKEIRERSMSAYHGYAGFRRPVDIVFDNVLSKDQKAETLLHWKRSVERLMAFGPDTEREAYRNLTIELADALDGIDSPSAKPHISEWRTSKSSKP
jgi:hypothetical protein